MPKQDGPGHKTLAIRLDPETHAQLSLLAQLDNVPLIEEIRQAIDAHITAKRTAGDFTDRARAALEDIEREASARRNAIEAMFGNQPAAAGPAKRPPRKAGNGG